MKRLLGLIKEIDRIFFNSSFLRLYFKRFHGTAPIVWKKFDNKMEILYGRNKNSHLNNLADLYGSDKGEVDSYNNPYFWPSHSYADFYDLIFRIAKHNVKKLIECGIGTNNPELASSMGVHGKPGASLRMWRDYFPNAQIIGCDIDKKILFSEDRISTYFCDQTSSSSIEHFCSTAMLDLDSIDIIIDDGLHTFEAGICFFESMIDYLNLVGVYIIEDVEHRDMVRYKNYFLQTSDTYEVMFVCLETSARKFGDDNNLVVIRKC